MGLLASLQGVTAPRGQRRRSRVTARPSWRTRRHHSQDSGQTGSRAVGPRPAPKGAERALCLGPVPAAPSAASAPAPQTLRPDPLPEMAVSCPGTGVTGGHRKGPLPFLLSARERLKAAPGATESFVGASSEATGHDGRKEGAFVGAGARRKLSIRALQFSSRTLFGGRGGVTPLRAAPWQAGGGVGRGASAGCSTRGCGQRGAARTPLPRLPLRGRPPGPRGGGGNARRPAPARAAHAVHGPRSSPQGPAAHLPAAPVRTLSCTHVLPHCVGDIFQMLQASWASTVFQKAQTRQLWPGRHRDTDFDPRRDQKVSDRRSPSVVCLSSVHKQRAVSPF